MLQEGLVLIAVMIIAEIIKKVTEGKHNRYLPAIVLIIGVIAQVIGGAYEGTALIENIFNGILIGGAAAGVYDFAHKTVRNK